MRHPVHAPTEPVRPWPRRLGSGAAAVLAALTALLVLRLLIGVASRSWPTSGSSSAPATVDDVVLGLLSWAAVVLCGWLSIGIALTAATRLPGRFGQAFEAVAQVVTPAVVRRSVAMVLGVSVSTLALPAGQASGGTRHDPTFTATASFASGQAATSVPPLGPGLRPSPSDSTSTPLSPIWRPTGSEDAAGAAQSPARPEPVGPALSGPGLHSTGAPSSGSSSANDGPGWRPTPPLRVIEEQPTLLTPALRADSAAMDHVTVRRGDSLWSIAARHLGPSATDAEIAHEWPRWYSANAELIGENPDLIHPGQQLLPPLSKVLR